MQKSGSLYRRLLTYAFAYKGYFALGVFGFVLFSSMEASLAITLEFFVNAIEGKSSDKLSFLPAEITGSIYFIPVAIIILSLFRGLGGYLGNFYLAKVGLYVVNDLRKQVFSHLMYLPQGYFDKNNSGELVSLIIFNIQQVTASVTEAVKIIFRDGMLVIFLLTILIYYNWKLTVVFFVVAPILGGLIYLAGRYFKRISRNIQKAMGRITHITTQSLQAMPLVKSYRGEKHEITQFSNAADDNLKFNTKFERVKAIQTPTLHFFIAIALSTITLLVLLFWDTSAGAASALAYIGAAGAIAKPFRQLTMVNSIIQQGLAASETIFGTIDLASEANTGKVELANVKGKIEFKKATFGYNRDETVLSEFDLTVEPGQTLALVGESGSGKSTIASLLLRLYDLNEGDILIDGTPIRDLELNNLRKNIALVNQNAILFNESVNANIAYGADLTDASPAAIQQAAKDAYADHFIQELETDYNEALGEGGDKLSGGQRQRITIARALLKNAPILILDEATSALDNESEQRIQAALENLKEGRTTIVIAHRLTTIENADKIAVLDKGKLVELGNHQSLIEKGGYYAALYNKSSHTR